MMPLALSTKPRGIQTLRVFATIDAVRRLSSQLFLSEPQGLASKNTMC